VLAWYRWGNTSPRPFGYNFHSTFLRAYARLRTAKMKKLKPISSSRSEWGQSLVEVAVSFMVLVLLLAVAVDLGRVFFSFIALREAAEEGALYASLQPSDDAGIEARVRDSSETPIDLSDEDLVEVEITPPASLCAGNEITVSLTYEYNLTMPLLGGIIGTQTFDLPASATATILAPACP
jgi:hypothetical protein